jgi:DNA-binding HxlR family transcriptional regulator
MNQPIKSRIRSRPRPSVFDPECSARDALELIASKWAILILTALAAGPMRNGALLRKVGGVSQKMLTQTLRDLECNGLVARRTLGSVPPHVEYRLTALGKSLSRALKGLDRWAERNFPRLDSARSEYQGRKGR